uniref:Solute carrier family 35 member C2 n=1 Tax=Caligus clemensi TaxID=344056 RepID=C1C355_CALCM|nr:Solute carrier family 35 member C2 [Caligus clemensi]
MDVRKEISWMKHPPRWTSLLFFLSYFGSSIGLTLYQKKVLRKYPYPLTIVLCHLFIKFILSWTLRFLLRGHRSNVSLDWRTYIRQLSIIGCTSAMDIGLSNWAIEFVTISLYTITKTTSIPFILLFALIFRLEKKSCGLISTVLMIFLGLFIFSYESTSFNFIGFSMALSASVLAGVRWTYTQLIMQKRSDLGLSNPIDMIYHVQPIMILSLIVFSISFEGETIATTIHGFRFHSFGDISSTLFYISMGAFLAFFMEVSEYFVIYSYSSLTLAITGVVKDIILILSGISLYHDNITFIKALGIGICMIGICIHVMRKLLLGGKDSPSSSSFQGKKNKQPLISSSGGANRSSIHLGDSIPLLSDSDDFSEEEELMTTNNSGGKKFKEMDDDFILNSDRRAWDSVKNQHINMSRSAMDGEFMERPPSSESSEGGEEGNIVILP